MEPVATLGARPLLGLFGHPRDTMNRAAQWEGLSAGPSDASCSLRRTGNQVVRATHASMECGVHHATIGLPFALLGIDVECRRASHGSCIQRGLLHLLCR